MSERNKLPRRDLLKQAAVVFGAATKGTVWPLHIEAENKKCNGGAKSTHKEELSFVHESISYPRVFQGRQLKMIAFPLGSVGAGSLRLGGRGQLRDWEMFNRPGKGSSPAYAFPAIWVQSGEAKPPARVLEARILPPYEGQDGLGSNNSPGFRRLQTAKFTGEYPLSKIEFEDSILSVRVELEAFSPFIPHDPDDSGLPVAILRYRVTNPSPFSAKVSVAFSIDNPVKEGCSPGRNDKRLNEYNETDELTGIAMSNPGLSDGDPMCGTFALAAMPTTNAKVTHWRGWPQGP